MDPRIISHKKQIKIMPIVEIKLNTIPDGVCSFPVFSDCKPETELR